MNERAIAAVRTLIMWFKVMIWGGIYFAVLGISLAIFIRGVPGTIITILIVVGLASFGIGLRSFYRGRRVLAHLESERCSQNSDS